MSEISTWRLMAPESSFWFVNGTSHDPEVELDYIKDSEKNEKLKGNWGMAFQASNSNYTFTPSLSISYFHEYGD